MSSTAFLGLAHERPLPQALALRYRVYCEEFGYLPADKYPAGVEFDEDDAIAAHFHLFEPTLDDVDPDLAECEDAERTRLTGYVRLVRPDPLGLLPVQRRCQLTLDAGAVADPKACAEVSRLIIAPEFRRRRSDGPDSRSAAQPFERRRSDQTASTYLLLHLFRQMFDYSNSHGIRYWFAAMERPLARSLGQMGFPFKAAGPEGEFFGRITPYVVDLHDLQHRVSERQPRLAQWFLTRPTPGACPSPNSARLSPVWARPPPPPQLWRAEA